MRKSIKARIFLIILVMLIVIWSLGPILWTFIISISPEKNLITKPIVLNFKDFNFSNYRLLLPGNYQSNEASAFDITGEGGKDKREIEDFKDALKNSIIVSSSTTIIIIIVSTIAGYAFTRFRYKGRRFLFLIIILTMPIPVVVLAIPLIKIIAILKLSDTYIGLSLLYTSFIMPLATWMSASYFQTIPKDLEEAGYIDGCTKTGA
ncbi:unnamed protein product, partial [marine sediment metagenome]